MTTFNAVSFITVQVNDDSTEIVVKIEKQRKRPFIPSSEFSYFDNDTVSNNDPKNIATVKQSRLMEECGIESVELFDMIKEYGKEQIEALVSQAIEERYHVRIDFDLKHLELYSGDFVPFMPNFEFQVDTPTDPSERQSVIGRISNTLDVIEYTTVNDKLIFRCYAGEGPHAFDVQEAASNIRMLAPKIEEKTAELSGLDYQITFLISIAGI